VARDASLLYEKIASGDVVPAQYFRSVFNALPDWLVGVLKRLGLGNFDAVQRRILTGLTQASEVLTGQAINLGQLTFEWAASFFIALYLAFFLMRDGNSIVLSMGRVVPLTMAHKKELRQRFTTVILATLKGSVLVALIQGALGGLAFWVLGVGGALLWAVLMGFASLLPAVGAALVWFPVALYFLLTGAVWKCVALSLFGVLVIGLVDNLLRPILVGKAARIPDYVIMVTTLGGIAVFGINGFVIGPVVAAMVIAVWHIDAQCCIDARMDSPQKTNQRICAPSDRRCTDANLS
jgi:predicted PurR-regulated permease PerM